MEKGRGKGSRGRYKGTRGRRKTWRCDLLEGRVLVMKELLKKEITMRSE